MDYLTKYYKNLCEQLEERLSKLQEAFGGAEAPSPREFKNPYSAENTPAANRQRQITDDMFDRMMGTRDPYLQRDTSYVKPASAEDSYLADKFREHRNAALDRMIAGQKEITNIWDEAGKKIKDIYSKKELTSLPDYSKDYWIELAKTNPQAIPPSIRKQLPPGLEGTVQAGPPSPGNEPTGPTQAQKDDEKFKQELQAKLAGIFQTIASININK
jgi:hypothetical protein